MYKGYLAHPKYNWKVASNKFSFATGEGILLIVLNGEGKTRHTQQGAPPPECYFIILVVLVGGCHCHTFAMGGI